MDSQTVVKALHDIDPGFVQLCNTLFGDAVSAEEVWSYIYTDNGLSKAMPDQSAVHAPSAGKRKRPRGRLMPVKVDNTVPAAGDIGKSDDLDIVWSGEFSKTDDEKRQVFGWASVVEVNGQPVIDRQGDWITPDEIEKAAYEYVIKSRKGGDQHKRDGDQPFHASDLIESFVVTKEKIEKMGLPADTPVGWWIGFKVHNEDTWQDVKKGLKTGFSIHGKGKRRELPLDEAMGYV